MINELLEYLKKRLNDYISSGNSSEQPVSFMLEEATDATKLPPGKIVPILIQIDEDKSFLPAERHLHLNQEGLKYLGNPSIALNLMVVFVSNYANYLECTRRLSQVIQFFQANAYFSKETHPDFPASIPEAKIELHSLSLTAQNEIWSMFRIPYRPSVVYKIKIMIVEAPIPNEIPKAVKKVETRLAQK